MVVFNSYIGVPRVCSACGAVVPHDYSADHDKWHEKLGHVVEVPSEFPEAPIIEQWVMGHSVPGEKLIAEFQFWLQKLTGGSILDGPIGAPESDAEAPTADEGDDVPDIEVFVTVEALKDTIVMQSHDIEELEELVEKLKRSRRRWKSSAKQWQSYAQGLIDGYTVNDMPGIEITSLD